MGDEEASLSGAMQPDQPCPGLRARVRAQHSWRGSRCSSRRVRELEGHLSPAGGRVWAPAAWLKPSPLPPWLKPRLLRGPFGPPCSDLYPAPAAPRSVTCTAPAPHTGSALRRTLCRHWLAEWTNPPMNVRMQMHAQYWDSTNWRCDFEQVTLPRPSPPAGLRTPLCGVGRGVPTSPSTCRAPGENRHGKAWRGALSGVSNCFLAFLSSRPFLRWHLSVT